MSNWYQMRERGAGKYRMEILWVVYRVFGLGVLKFVARIIAATVAIFASAPRAASRRYRTVLNEYERKHNLKLSRFPSIGHICTFAASVVDKMSAICDKKTPLKFAVADSPDWHKLQELLATKQGAFFICSHMGNIETWGAMPGGADVHMHAFMDMEVNHQFRDFIARHARYDNTTIHPVENIGMAAAGDMPLEFVPSVETVVKGVMRSYLSGFLYSALLDSFCSEQNARVTAMDAANTNAQELLGDLSLQLNRTRQSAITQEITEISAGAQAQKNKKKK